MNKVQLTITHNNIAPFEFNFIVSYLDRQFVVDHSYEVADFISKNFVGYGFIKGLDLVEKVVTRESITVLVQPKVRKSA